ncbi:aldo/keto reductase [Lentilitoribacter sp. EG35]|uniref:aldo/keto reductase n=1 Tax=Lentilitoribacter sp. EG35 TaxID=3234192 RepID=UPI00346129FC
MNGMNIELWNGQSAPRMGIGTWVMGGQQYWNGMSVGWDNVDDEQSLATLRTSFDLGVRIIDTAAQYGAGHSERIIGKAIKHSQIPREEFIVCTKAGFACDPDTGDVLGEVDSKEDITKNIDESLQRLGVEYLDLVKYHINWHPIDQSYEVFEAFEEARLAGKIKAFGWSTDDPERASVFADKYDGFVAVQHNLNLVTPANNILNLIEERKLYSFNRQPLAMGLLTGKYQGVEKAAEGDDIRSAGAEWMRYFNKGGTPNADFLQKIETARGILTGDGRSLAQGSLGYCLAKSPRTIPIPGCRTAKQARDNFAVIEKGPLTQNAVSELENLFA